MKHLNFLSKSGSQSMGLRVTTLALTVGSPSVHRRSTMLKLISVLVLIFTFGIGQMWGTATTEKWVKVTAAPTGTATWDGEYMIVYQGSSTTEGVAWTGIDAESCGADVTISSGVIASKPSGASSVTIASMTGGYSIKVNGGTNNGKYTQNVSKNGINFSTSAVANTLTYESNAVTITCGGKNFRYNNASGNLRFRYFGSAQQVIQLYKKVTLSSISVQTAPTKVAYTEGDNFAPSGLVIRKTWSDGSTEDITYNNSTKSDFTFSPTTATSLATSNTSVSITYGGKSTSQAITVNAAAVSYTVNWSITDGGGVLSATSGNSTTVTPTSGWRYASPAYEVLTGAANVNKNNNIFTATPTSDCTIRINMEQIPSHKINFHISGGTCATSSVDVLEGATYNTMPTVTGLTANCEYGTFVGWTQATSIASASTCPDLVTSVTMGTSNVDLCAVYSKTTSGGGNSGSVTITHNSTNFPTSYAAAADYELEGYTFNIKQIYKNGKMQWRSSTNNAGAGVMYNKDVFPAKISSVVVTYNNDDAGNNHTLKVGSSANPTSGTAITPTSDDLVYTFDCSAANADYFVLTNGEGMGSTSSVVINYGSSSTTTYSLDANCCTPLGSINGSVSLTQETTGANAGKLTASWDEQTNKTGWATNGLVVKIYAEGNTTPVFTTANPISKDATSYTATTFDPDYCTTYYATLTPVKADNTYCDPVESTQHESVTTKGQYTYHVTLSGMQLKSGENEETDNCSNFSAIYEVTGTSQLNLTEVAVTNVASGGYTWNAETGALTIDKTKVNGNVEITITGHAPENPTVAATSVNFAAVDQGATVPSPTTFTITGEHLTGNLSMTSAQESDPFTWTITAGSLEKNAQNEVSATVTVTPKSGITDEAGTKQASITISGGGASNVVVPISLTVQPIYTVSFSTGEGNPAQASIQEASYNAGITLPAGPTPACSIDSWAFAGWSETEVGSKTSSAPAQLLSGSYEPEGDITLYAVYSKAEAGGTSEETASVNISTYATAHNWTGNGSPQVGEIPLNSDITATTNTNGNNGKYYTDWRFYQSEGGTLTLTAATGCTLKKATITYGTADGGVLLDGETTINTGEEYTITGSLSSKSFEVGNSGSANNGKVKITAISVKYDKPATTTYYWSAPVCCTEKVTITKGENPANGTFTIDKEGAHSTCAGAVTVIVTPTPNEHFRVNAVTAPYNSDISGPDAEGKYTITFDQNTNAETTVNVTFVIKDTYKVTWNVNGDESTKTDVYDGEQPVFPSPAPTSCDDEGGSEAFYGWATAAWTGKAADLEDDKLSGVTIYTKASDMPLINGAAVTYYAVFAKATGGGSTPNVQIMNDNSTLNSNWNDDQNRNNGIQSYAGKSSFQMYGETNTQNACELTSKIKFNNITGISMNVAANNANTVYLFYSADGENWTTWENTVSVSTNTSSYTDYAFDLTEFPTGSYYICLSNSKSSLYMYSVTITSESEPEYSQFMTTCCSKHDVTIDSEIENGTVTASPASACEGATVTLTFSPNPAHHLKSWSVNGDDQDVNDNTFSMPAEDVEVSAVFEHDPCTNLAAPTLDGTVTVTYNSATINWNTVTNASSYDVTVIRHEDSESIFSGNVNALTKALAELDAETRYDYSIMAVGDGTDFCATGNGLLQGNFTTSELPTAHLTLIDANGTHASSGDYTILTPFNLPDEAASCSKTFIGWDPDEDCVTAPTYAKGAEFTFTNTTGVMLYAVYADVTGGGNTNAALNVASYAEENNWSNGTAYTTFTINGVTFTANGGGNNGKYYTSNNSWRLYNGGSISISAASGNIESVSSTPSRTFTISGNTASLSISSNTEFTSITVVVSGEPTYSNYSTECLAAPVATPDVDNLNDVAAAGASGTITMTYENVNTANVAVSLWNNEACTEAFSGEWLTASLNGDKNIAYTIAENTSYNDARSAYIKLTAPAEASGPADAVVIIPVTQAKKPAVFASLAELAAADVASGTEVTVTINNRITGIYTNYYDYRYGIYLNQQKYNEEETPVLKDIEIYFKGEQVPASEPEWVIGGTVSGTITCPWEYFTTDEIWELKPGEGWHWTDLTYNAPATVSSVTISGTTPDKTTYSVGEAFDPAGLTVHVEYSDESDADITASDDDWAYVTWNVDPATFAAEHIGTDKSVSATASYSGVSSTATEISGLTVNKVAVTGVTLNQNAATLKVGKKVTLTATVAPANATYKGIEWSTSDGSVATVENGEVTAVAEGSATITATSTDDNTKYATCAITVTEGINFAAGDWTLVKDAAELTVGSYVIIAAAEYDKALKSYVSGNNCGAEDAIKDGDLLEYDEDFGIFEIKAGNKANTIALFDDANENYLYAASGSSNHMKAETTLTDNSSWSVSVTSVGVASLTAQGTNSHNQMKYNHSNNPPIFSCYSSGQDAVALYKYYAPVPKVTYNQNTEDEVENLPAIQKTEWEEDAYKATVAAGPSRIGYTFTGWNSDAEGEGDAYAAGTKYSFAADIILYAQWNALPKFHVTYNTSGSQGATPTDATDYYEGDEVTLASASGLSNAGYFFKEWVATYVDGNSDTQTLEIEDGKFTMPAFDVTITATWARKSSDKWIKVTETSQLVANNEYIIVNTDATYAIGEQKSNNRQAAAIEENDAVLTISEAVAIFKLGIPEENKYTFYQNGTVDNVDKGYLYAASSGSNYLKTQVANDANGVWTISINEDAGATVTATGTNTRNIMRYNPNNGSPVFSCYNSSSTVQNPVVLYMKAPKIEINDNESVNVSDAAGSDIVIHDGGTLNVDADKQIGDLTVEAGGKVVLDANKLTVVGTFTLETTMASGASGQLTGATASNFATNGPAYIDITLGAGGRADHWHAITVPFPVDAINGIYDLDGNKLNNEEHYAIMEYLGNVRAQGKYGWKKYRKTLVPGTFYLMTVDGGRTTYRFMKTADGALVAGNSKEIFEYAKSGEGQTTDAGWNGVGNPTLVYGKVNAEVQVLDPVSYTYIKKDANSTNFVVGTPFFYQADGAGSISMLTADAGANYAPARVATNGIEKIKVSFGNEAFTDYLDISASEEALNEYQIGKDLVKMTMTNTPSVAQIFGNAYNAKLCMVYAPMVNDKATFDLTLYAPAAGTYTIAAPSMENATLYLTKNGRIYWNLTMGACELDLAQGQNNEYGLVLRAEVPAVTTGIENGELLNGENGVQKVVIDEHVYILRGGEMYDMTGKMVK